MPLTDPIALQLDRLAAFDSGPFPVVSLYLNLQPDQRGRDSFEPFLQRELGDRIRTYGADGPERASLEKEGAAARQKGTARDERTTEERIAGELVARARRTAAKIRFIEDPALLAAAGGVGGFLRFRL